MCVETAAAIATSVLLKLTPTAVLRVHLTSSKLHLGLVLTNAILTRLQT